VTRTALALSPHLDDAAFSCGGTLATLAQAGWRVVVATIFTGSVPDPRGFALACQLDKGLGPEVDYMALRRAEDAAAMRALTAAPPLHLKCLEAPHRGYGSAKALFEEPRPDDAIVGEIRAAVVGLLADHSPDLLFAPQAIGGHVDHVQLVRALAALDRLVLWWRDFPYSIRPDVPRRPFADTMTALPVRTVTLGPVALAAREAACAAYASQIGFQFGGPAALHETLVRAGPVESFSGWPALDP
jgi:LmbE family N-acetylglucosaminyl deacetylase